jgi:hypothetical protein
MTCSPWKVHAVHAESLKLIAHGKLSSSLCVSASIDMYE